MRHSDGILWRRIAIFSPAVYFLWRSASQTIRSAHPRVIRSARPWYPPLPAAGSPPPRRRWCRGPRCLSWMMRRRSMLRPTMPRPTPQWAFRMLRPTVWRQRNSSWLKTAWWQPWLEQANAMHRPWAIAAHRSRPRAAGSHSTATARHASSWPALVVSRRRRWPVQLYERRSSSRSVLLHDITAAEQLHARLLPFLKLSPSRAPCRVSSPLAAGLSMMMATVDTERTEMPLVIL